MTEVLSVDEDASRPSHKKRYKVKGEAHSLPVLDPEHATQGTEVLHPNYTCAVKLDNCESGERLACREMHAQKSRTSVMSLRMHFPSIKTLLAQYEP